MIFHRDNPPLWERAILVSIGAVVLLLVAIRVYLIFTTGAPVTLRLVFLLFSFGMAGFFTMRKGII
jgi:hypothetical protein